MGTSLIWYYPDRALGLTEVDVGELFTDLVPLPVVERASSRAHTGREYDEVLYSSGRVRVLLEDFEILSAGGRQLYADLDAIDAHLRIGGLIALCLDSDEGWAAFAAGTAARGDTTLRHLGAVYSYLPATPSSSTRVQVGGLGPPRTPELRGVSSNSGTTLTLDSGLRFSHSEAPLLIREEHTYLCLKLPADQQSKPTLTPQRGASATFDATLEVNPYSLRAHHAATGDFAVAGNPNGESFESAVAKYSKRGSGRRAGRRGR